MGNWIKKQKKEKFYKQAHKEGMRSRAAFKLRQIQAKYKVFSKSNLILDLCCAPGSWIQELKQQFGDNISIIGVDLVEMKPVEGVKFIQGDIRDRDLINKLNMVLLKNVDAVISDCAPKLTGSKTTDYARQIFLVERVLQIISHTLKKKGHMVCKLFDGDYTPILRTKLKQNFETVYLFKPEASRKKSPEIYLIGKFYKKQG
ncbi:MAG: SAM-dependent methyltransferase [Promethearchaeota archaeon]